MIKTKKVSITINPKTYEYYKSIIGGDISVKDIIEIDINHLSSGSSVKYLMSCDNCLSEFETNNKTFKRYNMDIPINCEFHYCKNCKSKKTFLDKYGVDNPNKSDVIRTKTINTCLLKYGSETPLTSDPIKEKIRKTNLDKYGVEHHSSNKEISDKIRLSNIETRMENKDDIEKRTRETILNKYNGKHYMFDDDIRDKIKKTNIDRYGVENVFSNNDIIAKIKESNIEKYGVDHNSKSPLIKKQREETCLKKYGVTSYSKTDEYKQKKRDRDLITSSEIFYKYGCSIVEYIDGVYTLRNDTCDHVFDTNINLFYQRSVRNQPVCTKCCPIDKLDSIGEEQIYEFLISNNIRVIRNDRTIISPKEIDLYLPDYKLAIEYNGLYWHSDIFKDKLYHYNKYISCVNENITLMCIWEDEWINNSDIVKSIVLNRIGKSINKIGARKCYIREIDNKESISFYNYNHIQGGISSKYNIGLYHNEELVSLMSFSERKINGKSEFELTRFVNKLNLLVIGSASKLFKYFIEKYKPKKINTYSDNSIFNGDVYEKLGFIKVNNGYINYWWCKGIKRMHRFTFNKKRLVKEGYDKNKTENQIMRERGYSKLYGCGHTKWIYQIIY